MLSGFIVFVFAGVFQGLELSFGFIGVLKSVLGLT